MARNYTLMEIEALERDRDHWKEECAGLRETCAGLGVEIGRMQERIRKLETARAQYADVNNWVRWDGQGIYATGIARKALDET